MTLRHLRFAALAVGLGFLFAVWGCKGKDVAEVNGQAITNEEFVNRLESLHGAETLQRMILQDLILQAAKEQGVEPTQEEVEEQLQTLKAGFPSEDVYYRQLKETGRDETDLRYEITSALALSKLQTKGVDPSVDQLRTFFQQNQQFFDQPERIRFHQIILATKEDADRVHGRLLEGINFEALASTDSIEPSSREQGGQVPVLPSEQIKQAQPELYELLSGLQPGQISEPTRISFRNPANPQQMGEVYAIVRLDEIIPAKQVSFEDVQDQVREAYMQQNARPQEQVLQELVENAKVLVYSDRYRWLENQFGGQPIIGEGLPSGAPGGEAGVGDEAPSLPSPAVPVTPPTPSEGDASAPVLPPPAGE